MKLVDILARDLKEWPEQAEKIQQSFAGMTFWQNEIGQIFTIERIQIAEDWRDNDEVTRAQWQAAVDALTNPEPAEWNGEDLPPVGTFCEVEILSDQPDTSRPSGWHETKILAHYSPYEDGDFVAVCSVDGYVYQRIKECFRPIRTAEQIAAEEREERLIAMSHAYRDATGRSPCAYVEEAFRALDAEGYRKQVQK